MYLLAIETSCDETCAAVVNGDRLLSNVIASQEIHQQYGGVVPELASRAHMQQIAPVVRKALERSGITAGDLQAIGVTRGPGLIGSLLVGISFAKGLALNLGVPLIGINHLEGHLFSNSIAPEGPEPPFLSLLVSGGHSILTLVEAWGKYRILGETQDDAAGEAFDKVAKILGLQYPGGPQIERLAANGNPQAAKFPVAQLKNAPFDFSFSGLKTAVLYHVQRLMSASGVTDPKDLTPSVKADVAASFQRALIEAIVSTTARAHELHTVKAVALAGGVACNTGLRSALAELGRTRGFRLYFPPPIHCTDNAAMIGRAAVFHLSAENGSLRRNQATSLDLIADPGLRLTSTAG